MIVILIYNLNDIASNKKILITDSHEDNFYIYKVIIAKKFKDLTIIYEQNAYKALEIAEFQKPDIIITDFDKNEKDMDGIKFVEKLREMNIQSKFVLISSKVGFIEADKLNLFDYSIRKIIIFTAKAQRAQRVLFRGLSVSAVKLSFSINIRLGNIRL